MNLESPHAEEIMRLLVSLAVAASGTLGAYLGRRWTLAAVVMKLARQVIGEAVRETEPYVQAEKQKARRSKLDDGQKTAMRNIAIRKAEAKIRKIVPASLVKVAGEAEVSRMVDSAVVAEKVNGAVREGSRR